MAWSRDPRTPTRFMRGSKRYNDVGGHSPPGDELENTRDHERIWFELKRSRSCCECDDPGFKYCFQTFDWPQYICEGQFPGGDTLYGYWAGVVIPNGVTTGVAGTCLGATLANTGTTEHIGHDAGSWRDGPYAEMPGSGLQMQAAGINWANFFPDQDRTFEAWIKPTASELMSGTTIISQGQAGEPLSHGGLKVTIRSNGAVGLEHIEIEGGALQESGPGWWEGDQWHHFVLVRNAEARTIAIFINGRLALSRVLPTDWSVITFPSTPQFDLLGSNWSDIAYYTSALSPSTIRKHYQSVYGVEGVANPLASEGATIEDPTTVITESIDIDIINGGGSTQVGYIAVSQGDYTTFLSPEDTPFELEERKDQASGYAGLNSDARLDLSKVGHLGTPSELSFLRGDRRWVPGVVVDKATEPGQLLVAGGGGLSDDYISLVTGASPRHYWKMTEAGAPPATIDNIGSAAQDFTSQGNPSANSDNPRLFLEETSLRMDGSGDYWTGPALFPGGENHGWAGSLWVYLEEIPAADKYLLYQSGTFQWGFKITSAGILAVTHNYLGSTVSGVTPLTVGVWHHVAFERTLGGTFRIYLDGVLDVDSSIYFFYTFGGSAQIGEAGLKGRIGHVAIWEGVDLAAGWAAAQYSERSLRWNPTDPAELGLGGGSSAAEDITVDDVGGYFTGADVEAVLQEIGAAGAGFPDAADVPIADAGGYFTGTDVEAALQELGAGGGGGGGGGVPYSAVKAYKSASQSLSDATWTAVTWDAEAWDTDDYHSTSSTTERFVVPEDGRYRITVILNWQDNPNNQRMASLCKNGIPGGGGTELQRSTVQAAGNFNPTNVIVEELDLTTADYFVIAAYQNRGGSLNILGGASGVVSSVLIERIDTVGGGGGGGGGVPYSSVKAYKTANTSHAPGAWTAITFTDEAWDTDGYHDNVTNPERFTIPASGRYRVILHAAYQADGSGYRIFSLCKNGMPTVAGNEFARTTLPPISPFPMEADLVWEGDLTAGDYILGASYHGASGAINLLGGSSSPGRCEMTIERVDTVGGGGGGSGSAVVFDEVAGVGGVASFDVTGIPAGSSNLRFALTGRGEKAATTTEVRVRANGDSGANYEWQRQFNHSGNNNSGGGSSGQTYAFLGEITAASATAGRAGKVGGSIHNYDGSVLEKIIESTGGRASDLHLQEDVVAAWHSTAAVTQLTFFCDSGDFAEGTRLTVWCE